jgi:hypothetical protein
MKDAERGPSSNALIADSTPDWRSYGMLALMMAALLFTDLCSGNLLLWFVGACEDAPLAV